MKFAIVAAIKAYVDQTKSNLFELAKKTVERNGYSVIKTKKENK